ncbi:hypothetical protein LOAG_04034 [Loa loa]|uniref:Uncharacterized protein n=1 Tax=Loa loa TaxID=7209 RepID=A0A1S0U389_LOALO|nr:hypothetical protein LOAG_04034 [Loa loa]EFO24449.2 hypothetical protein LOAG_04034 [Loa loa]
MKEKRKEFLNWIYQNQDSKLCQILRKEIGKDDGIVIILTIMTEKFYQFTTKYALIYIKLSISDLENNFLSFLLCRSGRSDAYLEKIVAKKEDKKIREFVKRFDLNFAGFGASGKRK